MADETDRDKRWRGNTDHDPKPDFASRRNVLQRGLAAPVPSGPGGISGGGARSAARPDRPRDPASFENKPPTPPRDVPIAAPNPGEKERPFKRRLEGRDTVSREQGASSRDQTSERKEFQRFAPGDLSRERNDRSR
ncbi:hypothetical protein J2Y55_002118 [Bosea sp. BE125]|uniref:hypothetical protein n=1 Tax=Bosea sp. BE125 TaxID=2817909 RepID=UPI002858D4FC|nr:hypothetical protein [Bosea sp. BE125]MDR6871110.1 hypothetical protein [Bosea sp. BE125]